MAEQPTGNEAKAERKRQAQLILQMLGEKRGSQAHRQIHQALKDFPMPQIKEMLRQARSMYDNGEMINNGSRRRTLGGCFLKLVRHARWLQQQQETQPATPTSHDDTIPAPTTVPTGESSCAELPSTTCTKPPSS